MRQTNVSIIPFVKCTYKAGKWRVNACDRNQRASWWIFISVSGSYSLYRGHTPNTAEEKSPGHRPGVSFLHWSSTTLPFSFNQICFFLRSKPVQQFKPTHPVLCWDIGKEMKGPEPFCKTFRYLWSSNRSNQNWNLISCCITSPNRISIFPHVLTDIKVAPQHFYL